jgi:hypothetical protein
MTQDFLAMLNHEYRPAKVDASRLHDEKYRLQLANETAQRDLVDRLLNIHRRQLKEPG